MTYPTTIAATGAVYYKPNSTNVTSDLFTFSLIDNYSVKSGAAYNCAINVSSVGFTLTATSKTYYTPAGTMLTVSDIARGLLGSATYPTNSAYRVNVKISSSPYGSLTLTSVNSSTFYGTYNGTFTYYPPNSSFTGQDTARFYIEVTDASTNQVITQSTEATVTFNVGTGIGSGGYSRYSTPVDTSLSVSTYNGLLSGLGSGYYIQRNTNSSSYFTTVNSDGSFTFVPPAGQSGIFTLYYTLYNTNGNTSSNESVSVDVVPVAVSASYSVTSGTAYSISSTEAKSKNLGSNLRANLVTNPSHGTVTLNTDCTFTYTPTSGYTGSDSFTYTVTDTVANLTSPTATVTFNVAASAIVDTIPTDSSGNEVGIAVTGESNWLSWMLYALGIMSLLIGSRAVYLAVQRMRYADSGE